MEHRSLAELEAGLDHVRASPADSGRLEMVVRRPSVDQRELLIEAELSLTEGVVVTPGRSGEALSPRTAAPTRTPRSP
jgi:hypothetical protein